MLKYFMSCYHRYWCYLNIYGCYIMVTLLLNHFSIGQDTPILLQPLVVYTTPALLI